MKLDHDIKARLQQSGAIKRCSLHWLMQQAVIKDETLARWHEAESGNFVSNEAMMEWLDSWGTEAESNRPPCGS